MSDFKYLLLYYYRSVRTLPAKDDDFMAVLQQNIIWNFRNIWDGKWWDGLILPKLQTRKNFFLALGLHQELDQEELSRLSLNTTLYWWDQVKKMTSSLKIFFQYVEVENIILNLILIHRLILSRQFHFSLPNALSARKVWTSPDFCWFTQIYKARTELSYQYYILKN